MSDTNRRGFFAAVAGAVAAVVGAVIAKETARPTLKEARAWLRRTGSRATVLTIEGFDVRRVNTAELKAMIARAETLKAPDGIRLSALE